MSSYLNYDATQIVTGNNPYSLNRMTIDPRFKQASYDLNTIKGYSATGELLGQNDQFILDQNPRPNNLAEYRTMQQPVEALNAVGWSIQSKIQQIDKLSCNPSPTDWQRCFNGNPNHVNQLNLKQITEQRYNQILSEKRG